MPHLEPTYLRYIYDGLIKGSIHPENAAELPEGLIGLYEEAFDERTSVVERQKLLQRFAIWALLKKEVSAEFAAEVLGEPEEEILNFISTYSAWFNSPESSKYQLYHERLKVYLLQKLSEGEVVILNESIVDCLEQKVNEEKVNETVRYCFEFHSFHLYLSGYLSGKSELLAKYCLDDEFKNRQFEISGDYHWEEKLMFYGVEFFSIKKDPVCHQIVFQKTIVINKKKNIDLLLKRIRMGELETVYLFFQNIRSENLHGRIELVYYYILSFFEIFEKADWPFIKRKETAAKLLEIFELNFMWDSNAYWISSYVDVNISFRLHCYFEQYGLDFKSIAKHSSDSAQKYFDLASNSELKFIGTAHIDEGKKILIKSRVFDYGFNERSIDFLIKSDFYNDPLELNSIALNNSIKSLSKTQLIRDELSCISYECENFAEIYEAIKFTLKKEDSPRDLKLKILRNYKKTINDDSKGFFSVSGIIENSEGINTLEIYKNDLKQITAKKESLLRLISEGVDLNGFLNMESSKQYNLLNDENLNSEEDIELMLFFLEISEQFQKETFDDIERLLCALLVEYHLNINEELIDRHIEKLNELIQSISKEASEEFESKLFIQLIDYFGSREINGYRKKTSEIIKETLIEAYFDFSFYKYSLIAGCHLINLYSKLDVDFPEHQIVDRILEDLNYLIEENEYYDICEIESSHITDIYIKPYFWNYYNKLKTIEIEEVRNNMIEYIFKNIIKFKGLNQKTLSFFQLNHKEFPGMYSWTQKELSETLSGSDLERSYLPIIERNDLLLERLLKNIVSKRENLKDELNIQILKHYGLDWVIELDNEYEKLITN